MTDETTQNFDPSSFEPEEVPEDEAALADEVQSFWETARGRAGLGKTSVVIGQTVNEAVAPPAWSFGDNEDLADALVGAVLAGEKTGTSTALWEFEDSGEKLPTVGELSIVLDGAGHPRALIRTTEVEVVPFDEVTEDFAAAEGEDDRSLAMWREGHEAYFRRNLGEGREFAADMPVLCERFELLYPTM
ncbi:ASCH domain-containing protein [Antribacter gilvus]|uniref:ASCH domain-containing protein n=1 Tax=Antribacter gilvus TaxID=2304675 RepID=UPI001F0BC47D|nr:ASCH domain-containing protein [Antribacter gilvus]